MQASISVYTAATLADLLIQGEISLFISLSFLSNMFDIDNRNSRTRADLMSYWDRWQESMAHKNKMQFTHCFGVTLPNNAGE